MNDETSTPAEADENTAGDAAAATLLRRQRIRKVATIAVTSAVVGLYAYSQRRTDSGSSPIVDLGSDVARRSPVRHEVHGHVRNLPNGNTVRVAPYTRGVA